MLSMSSKQNARDLKSRGDFVRVYKLKRQPRRCWRLRDLVAKEFNIRLSHPLVFKGEFPVLVFLGFKEKKVLPGPEGKFEILTQ